MSDYTLSVYNPVLRGNAYAGDWTALVPNWERSLGDVHGFKQASGSLTGPAAQLEWFFLNGLMWEIREQVAGRVTWQGFIAEMKLEIGDDVWVRSIVDCANAVKAVYSKIGDNQFTNGSAELAAWTAVGSPTTHERTTSWATHHTYSMHVVTDAADEGTKIEHSGTPETLSVTAGLAYQCRVTVKVVSGTWNLVIRKVGAGTIIASTVTPGTGKSILTCILGEENAYTGDVYVRLEATGAGAEIYADAAVFQLSPYRADTEWLADADAIVNYGRKEHIIVMGGQTDDGGLAEAQKYLNTHAWPMTRPPRKGEATQEVQQAKRFQFGRLEKQQEMGRLEFEALGYWATMGWRYTTTYGTQALSTWLADLVALQSDYLNAGIIDTNALDYQVEETIPLTLLEAMREAIAIGDSSGNRWLGGTGAERKFNYERASNTVKYHYRKGRIYSLSGSVVEPTAVKPGLYRHDDMPFHPDVVSSNEEDDPRNVWVSEVKFVAPDEIKLYREVGEE